MAVPSLSDSLTPQSAAVGEVSGTPPAKLGDSLHVKVPSAGLEYGPVPWMPLPEPKTMPAVGDICLVIFDEDENPWVVAWGL